MSDGEGEEEADRDGRIVESLLTGRGRETEEKRGRVLGEGVEVA